MDLCRLGRRDDCIIAGRNVAVADVGNYRVIEERSLLLDDAESLTE